jgi:CRP-like cAMP-binding protein
MTQRERLEVLRGVTQFAGCGDDRLRSLTQFVDEVWVPAGTTLAEPGRLCHELVIVASGELETCRSGRAGRLGPGDTFGWKAMQERGTNDATLCALSPAHLLVMSHQQFQAAAALV